MIRAFLLATATVHAVETTPLSKLIDPLVGWVGLVGRCSHHGSRAMHEEAAQMLAPAFRDTHQYLAIAARKLSGNKPDPGGEMTTVLELRSVVDGGDDRRRGFGTDALDLGDSLAGFIAVEYGIDLLIKRSYPPIQIPEEIVKLGERLARHGGQLVVQIG
jgi:hypothetical protein